MSPILIDGKYTSEKIKNEISTYPNQMLVKQALSVIDEVLDNLIEGVNKHINHISIYVKRLLEVMEAGVTYTTSELMELLDMKSRVSFRENYLIPAIDNGVVKMSFPDNPTNKNQTYYNYYLQ